jgi:hypothetical protein
MMTVENMMEGPGGVLYPSRDTPEEAAFLQQWRAQKEAAQQHEERLLKVCQELIELWQAGLKDEIAVEAAIARDPQIDKDWHAFRDFCKQHGAESLPAEVGMVLSFLGQSKPKDVARLHRNIGSVHNSYFNNPCSDLLTLALVRQARATSKSSKPQQKNGKAH